MSAPSLVNYLENIYQGLTPREISQPSLAQAAVLLAITDEASPQVVLTRRAKHMKTHQGDIAFPGGKVDKEDPNIEHTALREAQEEVGIEPSSVHLIGSLDQVVSKFGVLITPVLGVIPADTPLSVNEDELDAVFLTPLSLFEAPPSGFFERDQIKIPSYDFGEYHIWGLTAMMMAEAMNHFYRTDIHIKFGAVLDK